MAIFRTAVLFFIVVCAAPSMLSFRPANAAESFHQVSDTPDLTGEWEIQEEDKSYTAILDKEGNGPYTWQGGHITTLGIADRKWDGTWQQPGNDREGSFELLLSEDGREAKGVWWYTRVGDRKNIPARQWGGTYVWKRLSASPSTPASTP
ncbi:MAG: hypothetical protein M3Z35_14430 [Nitrospirota bacterium]|nr:hypothetical protein [Nitrospirota bacterium]